MRKRLKQWRPRARPSSKLDIYHFISSEDWNTINNNGGNLIGQADPYWASKVLGVRFGLFAPEEFLPLEILRFIASTAYLVGIPKENLSAWESNGLVDLLIRESRPQKDIRLLIHLPTEQGCFVREHRYRPCFTFQSGFLSDQQKLSEARKIISTAKDSLVEKLPPLLRLNHGLSPLLTLETLNFLYYLSTMPLRDYTGQYLLPEVWVPYSIAMEHIKNVEIVAAKGEIETLVN